MESCPREMESKSIASPFFDCLECPYSFTYGKLTFCNYVFKNS